MFFATAHPGQADLADREVIPKHQVGPAGFQVVQDSRGLTVDRNFRTNIIGHDKRAVFRLGVPF